MLWSQKIDVVEMDSKKRWMSAAVWSFFWDTVWTNGVDFGVGLDVGGHRGRLAFKHGGGLENLLPKWVFDVEMKNRPVLVPDIRTRNINLHIRRKKVLRV